MKRFGFTLAEVLITLGIIGVVAALTIPALLNNIQDAQYKMAYKKAYSMASQAWASAYGDGDLDIRTSAGQDIANYNNFNKFMAKFKILKTCTTDATFIDCWAANETVNTMWGLPFGAAANGEICFLDTSGMSWCNSYRWSYMLVDTNGLKNPNQYGKDRFMLYAVIGNGATVGVPNVIKPNADDNNNIYTCPTVPKCYSTSWLYN